MKYWLSEKGGEMMTPKDQWIAFFEHRYTNDAVPAFQGLGFVVEVHGFHETAKYVKDSNEPRGRDWFGVQWVRDDTLFSKAQSARKKCAG
jgi:hypothetical protein